LLPARIPQSAIEQYLRSNTKDGNDGATEGDADLLESESELEDGSTDEEDALFLNAGRYKADERQQEHEQTTDEEEGSPKGKEYDLIKVRAPSLQRKGHNI
jgi:hypothetical protein